MASNRIQRFEQQFGKVDMSQFYQLHKGLETVHIDKTVHPEFIVLCIQYKKSCPSLEFDLPIEMNEKIREYLIYDIEIQLKIKYSPSYPFSPPVWFLQHVKHNLSTDVSLLDYYSYKVNQHNQSYTSYLLHLGSVSSQYEAYGWNPAISVEGDILSFLQKIYHFDEVVDCV